MRGSIVRSHSHDGRGRKSVLYIMWPWLPTPQRISSSPAHYLVLYFKEKGKCWWQMASFITFNWLTILLSLWNTLWAKALEKEHAISPGLLPGHIKKCSGGVFSISTGSRSKCVHSHHSTLPSWFLATTTVSALHKEATEMSRNENFEWNCCGKGNKLKGVSISLLTKGVPRMGLWGSPFIPEQATELTNIFSGSLVMWKL